MPELAETGWRKEERALKLSRPLSDRHAAGTDEAPDEPGAQQERPANAAGVAVCPRPCGNPFRNLERRCALSVGAHDLEKMRAAPGVDAAMPDANEAKAFIAEGTAQAGRGDSLEFPFTAAADGGEGNRTIQGPLRDNPRWRDSPR